MSYTKVSPQPQLRDPNNDAVSAPGLYPSEVAVQLDTGEYVAVYVERTWQENNAGLAFYTSARLINADGSTKLCVAGKEIVIEVRTASVQKDIQQLQKENQQYSSEVDQLKSDPKRIEKEAREQFHYARPGEVIYVSPEKPAAQAPANRSASK